MTGLAALTPLWVTSRASGIAALLCASAGISAGVLMAIKPSGLKLWRLELRAAHEALALGTFALIAVHALTLFLDPVLKPGLTGLLVPFAATYEPFATGLGQLAAYGMVGLGLTFYVRRRLGSQRWRRAHRFIPIFWALGVAHGLLVGTDAGTAWFLVVVGLPVLAGAALLASRYRPRAASHAIR